MNDLVPRQVLRQRLASTFLTPMGRDLDGLFLVGRCTGFLVNKRAENGF
jgi:hypothetical protein